MVGVLAGVGLGVGLAWAVLGVRRGEENATVVTPSLETTSAPAHAHAAAVTPAAGEHPSAPHERSSEPSSELGRRIAAVRDGVEQLPREQGARRAALLRLERAVSSLRSEPGASAHARQLEGLAARIELELVTLDEEPAGQETPPASEASPAAPSPGTSTPEAHAAAPRAGEPRAGEPRAGEPRAGEPRAADTGQPATPAPVSSEQARLPVSPAAAETAPTREATKLEDELSSLQRELLREQLLAEVFARHDARDRHGLAAAVAQVEEKAGRDSPEAKAARALRDDLSGRFLDSAETLRDAAALEAGGRRAATARVRALFGTLRYEEARAALTALDEHEAKLWTTLIDGPFAASTPLAAAACQALTPDRRYRVVTDLGLPAGQLEQLEARLQRLPEAERAKLIARTTKAHRGLTELCDVMDKACRAFGKLLASEEAPQVFPTVYVLHDRTQFDRFSAALDIHGVENALGYYLPGYRVLVFYDQPEGRVPGRCLTRGTLQVLLHETFHQWMHLQVEDAPRWFDEGMGEFFGIGEMTGSGLRYGLVPTLHPSRLDNIREAFGGLHTAPMKLRELVRADRATFYGGGAPIYYAQAWSFVHYLAATPRGKRLLRDYFHALRQGKGLEEAYQEVFAAVDLEGMELDWRQYVGSLH